MDKLSLIICIQYLGGLAVGSLIIFLFRYIYHYSIGKPCCKCCHLKYGFISNEPICPLNDDVYMGGEDISKFSCRYWNISLAKLKGE